MKSLSMESDFLFLGWTVHDARQEKQVRYQQAVAPGPYRELTRARRSEVEGSETEGLEADI
jgi:hypothetical protein